MSSWKIVHDLFQIVHMPMKTDKTLTTHWMMPKQDLNRLTSCPRKSLAYKRAGRDEKWLPIKYCELPLEKTYTWFLSFRTYLGKRETGYEFQGCHNARFIKERHREYPKKEKKKKIRKTKKTIVFVNILYNKTKRMVHMFALQFLITHFPFSDLVFFYRRFSHIRYN